MTDQPALFTIGQLARRTGLAVRTIRFWSDDGVVPPTARSGAGYRLYNAEAVARLELVSALRELGLDLATVRRVVLRQQSVTDVARTHLRALDAEIRLLRLRRALLWSVVYREGTTEEIAIMNKFAHLSPQERQRVLDGFVDEVFEGVTPETPGAGIASAMRQLPVELPEEPTAAQVDAWIELAELVADVGFRRRIREMVEGAGQPGPDTYDPGPVLRHAGAALEDGLAPASAEARAVVDRIVGDGLPAAERIALAREVEVYGDRRVERYWQLLAVVNGWSPCFTGVAQHEWFAAALRATA
ncbi:MerR family transcriptional regulator [Allokutzneria sp. A3M-2-11 16]|uniref:helix-turn-helix domain-containing protein n=1 Tax=Allokutzneria sp. A3M-2-11 16 TaxID=2962043 RepID=UPI0020B76047|nr:MerR family transcriptional regulator [Allokutzneria sp. A3M-2-11 16]MCP3801975.1 MerR family transcriptional regulator [Allokutzneria sp. A3M-2-11 16]